MRRSIILLEKRARLITLKGIRVVPLLYNLIIKRNQIRLDCLVGITNIINAFSRSSVSLLLVVLSIYLPSRLFAWWFPLLPFPLLFLLSLMLIKLYAILC